MTDQVLISATTATGLSRVTLNRPEQLNALTDTMVVRLAESMAALAADPAVRVIVLTGAGRAFCSGADVSEFGAQTPREVTRKLPRPFDQTRPADFQTRHLYFPALPKPVIAMINGATAGLGLLYALAADIRFVAAEAVVTTGFARLGLHAEYGLDWLLHRAVGHAHALELMLSSRKLRGEEAARLGLAHFVEPLATLEDRAMAYAEDMATGCSPQSFALIKRQMWDASRRTAAQAVIASSAEMLMTNASADFSEGKAAFMERRTPRFPPWTDDN